MAQHAAAATGNWSAGATWNQITNTPTLHASTNLAIDGTGRFTATFTSPGATISCTGVLLYITAVGTGGTVTVTLQEATIDTLAARTINITSLVANSWVYFRFASPHLMAVITANTYRFKVQVTSPTGTTNAATDSGGTLYCFLATDNRAAVPASTDDVWIVGHNQATAITVTMDGTQTIGSGTDVTGINRRTIGAGIVINNSGLLTWDIAASATLTCKGNVIVFSGGELRMGTVAVPYPTAYVATLSFNENGTSVRYGLETHDNGKLTLQGRVITSTSLWKTTYSSGAGTAASPMIVADSVDWTVGDEIIVCAYSSNATNYQESENKFIITKNSATSYVLSDTAGGVEAAFTYTHTAGAYILNVQRNIIIKSTTTTESTYYNNNNTTAGDVNIDWARFETVGANVANKTGLHLAGTLAIPFAIDYTVCYRSLFNGIAIIGNNNNTITMTGLISTIATNQAITMVGSLNKTFVDCFAVKNTATGFNLNTGGGNTFTRCVAISNNLSGGGGTSSGINVVQSKNTFNSCEAHCNRGRAVVLQGADVIFNNFLCGTKGTNAIDVSTPNTVYIKTVFNNSTFGSATLVGLYTSMLTGSEIAFHTLNGTANNHVWYTNTGIARSSGAGLVDTTTKTAGNLAVRLAPEDLTIGFVWEFLIALKASSAAQIVGFAQKNAAFGTAVCTVELFLPGSTTADATYTLDNSTGAWQVFVLAASYTGLVGAFATIRITAKTATASAYVYFTDFYNGTNALTGLQAWYNGKPTPVMTDLLGDPASVWAILTSTQSTAGTIGKLVVDNLNATMSSRASQTSVDDLPTNAELTTALGTADDTTLAAIAALNNLSQANIREAVGLASANLDTQLDALPTNAELATALGTADDAILSRLPAALVSGRMDSSVGAIAAGLITVKKNTAISNFTFLMRDSTDHITPKTGLTITAARSIDGAAFGACANSATELSNGVYLINLAAADLNGSVITLKFTATGADQRTITILTQA